jgi:hypothetical protein
MGVQLKHKNRDGVRRLIARAKHVDIKIGVQGSDAKRDHGGVSIADIAAIHEFGLGNNPERSWLRAWHDENAEVAREKLRKGYRKVLTGEINVETLGTAFGIWAVSSIQERIAAGIAPGLEAETIARKGSSVPLIDTGLFRSSITYVLESGDMIGGVIP